VVHGQTAVDALAIYRAAAPPEFFQDLRKASGLRAEGGVYTVELTTWMMMRQRLDPKGTLSTSVQDVAEGRPQALLPTHKRLTEGTLCSNTGGYSEARRRLGQVVVEDVAGRIFNYLMADAPEALPGLGRQVFLLDGSSLDLPDTPELRKAYPPAQNQHGDAHGPVVRIVLAHDLISGLAMQPCWGPMYGDQAVSEQALATAVIGRLPAGSVVVADRNFGVFSTAYDADQSCHPILARLTDARARHLLQGRLPQRTDQWVDWKPSRWERAHHPDLPADACVRGRVIACQVTRQGRTVQLYFFTTLELPPEEIAQLYGYRWNIGVSSQGHIVQSVKDRPRSKDSDLVAWEASWRESKTAEPSDNMLGKECAQRTRLQRTVNADVASLHESPVAETVDNARKQQGLAETSPIRQLSPAGYQRRHGVKDDVETGETLGARRRNLVEEMPAITVSGKCGHRRQGDGSGRSTGDGRAAKRARREGPGPVSTPLTKVRQG
jgi:hypothetical protein